MSTQTNPPANPAKGNLQGQTTLAAKIDRWQNMNDHVQAQLAAFPQLKDFQVEFQQIIDEAKALRLQMKDIEAESLSATSRRNDLIVTGDDLFSRLNHGLRSALGPKSELLVRYGLKRGKVGRKAKAAQPAPTPGPPAPPPVEVQGHPAVDPGPPAKE
ncbi:MAG TPA: hypothetical protein VFE33_27010 [Thermoanaerobaculia bacterium]|nr:hypothetical protein [Thermoanaerobaculia bacterium]